MGFKDEFFQKAQQKAFELLAEHPEEAQTVLETVGKVQGTIKAAKAGEEVDYKATAQEVKAAAVKVFQGFQKK